jgi:L-iditol 2-dehydrogenase
VKAAFVKAPFQVEFRDLEEPELGPGQVLLRPKLVGLCGTDIQNARHLAKDWMRFGHEPVAEVVALGPGVKNIEIGTKVACQCRAACGYCRGCLMGRAHDCENGADHRCVEYFAELVAVDRRSMWPIGELSDHAAMLLEPMGMAFDINRLADTGLESTVAIVGPGPIGLMAIRVARLRGARRVIVVGTSADRARFALCEKLGATATVCIDDGDPVDAVDAVMNTASIASVPDSLLMCRFGGVVVFMGEAAANGKDRPQRGVVGPGAVPIDVNWMHHNRLELRGSWAVPNGLLPLGAQLLSDREFPVEEIVNRTYDWTELETALRTIADRSDGVVKAAVRLNGD